MRKITPIILSGGVGLRLWPLSTTNLPKQFLKLPFNTKYNLFEQTLLGLKKSKVFDKPLILCSDKHKFLILESLEKLKISFEDIIVEKISKNTASSVLLGVMYCVDKKKSENSLILPSDHFIPKRDYSRLIPKSITDIYVKIIKITKFRKYLNFLKNQISKKPKFIYLEDTIGIPVFFY